MRTGAAALMCLAWPRSCTASRAITAPTSRRAAAAFCLGTVSFVYGGEWITEWYYRVQAGGALQVSPGMQLIVHPGYNRDRGPATVLSVRVNLRTPS